MCAIFGVLGSKKATRLTYLGIFALQHRGQESAGIVAVDKDSFKIHKDMGLAPVIFGEHPEIFKQLKGSSALGHVRYSTTGLSRIEEAQPLKGNFNNNEIAIVHNGNLLNVKELKEKIGQKLFLTTSDSEILLNLIGLHLNSNGSNSKKEVIKTFKEALREIKGSYSFLVLTSNWLAAVRDPCGFRPLVLGKLDNAWIFSSETCGLDVIKANYIRDVLPGEIIIVDKNGLESGCLLEGKNRENKEAFCVFEFIYFSRPDSKINGYWVHEIQRRLGRQLAKECPAEADIVTEVPDSAICAALGYSDYSRIPYEKTFIRNHYTGRTFIKPQQRQRDLGVQIKFNPLLAFTKGKKIAVIDDSLVRGTTSRDLIKLMFSKGEAKKVHYRLSSPPIKFPCYYGIDTHGEELIASFLDVEKIKEKIGATSLGYLSLSGLKACMEQPQKFCYACFDGNYPIPPV